MIELLTLPFLVCVAMVGILGYLGIHVLKREIIFIDIALAQIAAVGSIVAAVIFHAREQSLLTYVCAFGLTLIAAVFYSLARKKVIRIPLEAVIGISYAISAALALFIVAKLAEGHAHVEHMLAGSILWAGWQNALLCVVVFSTVGFLFYIFRKPFMKISSDYEGAVIEGMRVVWWDLLFYALFGIVITVAVRIAGVLVVFSFLIIPATISVLFSARFGVRLAIAWIFGIVMSIMGLVFSYYFDFSIGPSVASFLGMALIVVGIIKR